MTDRPSGFTYLAGGLNLDNVATLPATWDCKHFRETCSWFTEITNTYPHLDLDGDLQPLGFTIRAALPALSMSAEAEQYRSMVINTVEEHLSKSLKPIEELLHGESRPFMHLVNMCGGLKSAYAEVLMNQVLIVNMKNPGKKGQPLFEPAFLDNYIDNPFRSSKVLEESLADS